MGTSTWQMFPDSTVTFNQGDDEFTVLGSDLTSPSYDFLSSLPDWGMSWQVVNGVVQITGTANPSEMIPVAQTPSPIPVIMPSSSPTTLVGAIAKSTSANSSYMNAQNVILDNHSKLLRESNDINRVVAEQLIRANDINASTAAVIATSFDRLIELKRVENAASLYNGYIQEDMANALNKTSTSTQALSDNQIQTNSKIVTGVDSQIATNNKVQALSTNQIQTNSKIVTGVDSQIATNNKVQALSDDQIQTNSKIVTGVDSQIKTNSNIDEHHDYQKEKNVTDSDGNKFSPREIEAKANAENHLEKKDSNNFDWKDFFVNILGDGSGVFDDDNDSELIDSVVGLLEKLKVTPFENIDSIDNSKVLVRKDL